MFDKEQNEALEAPLDRARVKKNPKGYFYVEGWHVIAEANRIFGYEGWDRETLETHLLGEPEYVDNKWRVAYRCRVRVTVRAGEQTIVREGSGYGSGILKDLRDAHEGAIKEAETDAMKRALMTFGNQFGLALYDKEQTNVCDEDELQARRDSDAFVRSNLILIANFGSVKEMTDWWNSEDQKKARRDFALSPEQLETLKNKLVAQKAAIEKKEAA